VGKAGSDKPQSPSTGPGAASSPGGAEATCPLKDCKASVTLFVADPRAIEVSRDGKGGKLALTIEIRDDATKKPVAFDGKVVLEATANGDRIKLLDDTGKDVTLPLTLQGKNTPRLLFKVQGAKASGGLDDIALAVKIEQTGVAVVGATPSATAKLTVVDLRAEDGTADPPHVIPVKNAITDPAKTHKLKLKAIPDLGGTWQWTTASTKLTITDPSKQTVELVAKDAPSAAALGETVELLATPPGRPPIKLVHELGVIALVFSPDSAHDGGYDKHETFAGLDGNSAATSETPDPKHDIMCIEKSKEGTVKFVIKGGTEKDIFFASDSDAIAKPKTEQPAAPTGAHTLVAGAKDKDETILNARVGSKTGPIITKLGVVVLKRVEYEAEFFRVKDSASAGSALTLAGVTGAKLQTGAVPYYKQAIATLKISGGTAEKDVAYDSHATKSTKNGALDLEPGKTSDEEKIIMAACVSSKSRAVQVHSLRWAYYFAADATAGDTKIRIKSYGATYLGYIGTKAYTISDAAGHTERITVKSVDKTTGWVELQAALTNAYKTADKAALIWPLGGLSGDPVWVSDKSTEADLVNYVVHELGHQLAGWSDVCETNNFMHGGSATGALLRHRPIKRYYDTAKTEKQWKDMRGR
jgi:hypothetical protein